MKITYVIDYLYSLNGGTERQLFQLIEGMVQRGHEVELVVLRDTEFTRELPGFPCPVRCLGFNSILSMRERRMLWLFRKSLIARNIEVIHGFFNDVALFLPPLMIGTGVKTYTSRRDMGIWYTPAKLTLLRLFRSTATKLICNCNAVAKLAHETEWKPKESIQVIYNGIDPLSDTDDSHLCNWAHVQEEGAVNVVLVANVRPVKRIEDLIKAANQLKKQKIRLQYYVVGHLSDQVYFETLQILVQQYQLKADFHFVGQVAEPRFGLSRFNIGVLTSASEGLSNTIMEYLYAGLPVVASRVGGNPELVTDGHNGLLYEAGDHEGLANCLYRLATEPELRQAFAVRSKDAMKKFDSYSMVEQHEKEYSHV